MEKLKNKILIADNEVVSAIKEIVDYLYADEEKHFNENKDQRAGHIFNSLSLLSKVIKKTAENNQLVSLLQSEIDEAVNSDWLGLGETIVNDFGFMSKEEYLDNTLEVGNDSMIDQVVWCAGYLSGLKDAKKIVEKN